MSRQPPTALQDLFAHLAPASPTASQAEETRQAAAGLAAFAASVRARIAAERPHSLAAGAANQVEVQPGGKTFATIGAALASITDASLKKQYVLYIGPGTYNERVVCKPWVFLQGSGSDETVITAPATFDFNDKGTVIGASNSALQNLSVFSTGSGWGSFATAVACNSALNFDIENCFVQAKDEQGGANIWAITTDYQGGASGSVVYLSYTSVLATMISDSQPLGLLAATASVVQLTESKVAAQGRNGWGVASASGSSVTLYNCFAGGDGFSLNIPDHATLIANQCQLQGPVGSGVVVNP